MGMLDGIMSQLGGADIGGLADGAFALPMGTDKVTPERAFEYVRSKAWSARYIPYRHAGVIALCEYRSRSIRFRRSIAWERPCVARK